jgi:hypothetical protein
VVAPRGARRTRALALVLATAVAATLVGATVGAAPVAGAPADDPVPTPLLTAPPAGLRGHALWDSYVDLAPFGYEDQELLVSGTATDGSGATAPYTTRIIVNRPTDPSRFNGVVLLDWVNVTAQFENAVDTMLARPMLLREGFAFVHVSVQEAGICCLPGLTPKLWDPVRYAALSHPGDEFAFDLLTQVAQAFRGPPAPGGLDPMGDVGVARVEHVLAAGQSQSGIRLHTYVDRWLPAHPSAVGVIDGFLVHGDVGQPRTFQQQPPVPVLKLESDFEAVGDGVDPDDLGPNLRLWEVAGTSHSDLFIGYQSVYGHGPRVMAGAPRMGAATYAGLLEAAGQYGEQPTPLHAACVLAGATMPMRYATSAALHHLARWVDGGPAPASGPRFRIVGGTLARDPDGNTLGGIRLPPIDVPVASYGSTSCALGGLTFPFSDAQLAQRYGSHGAYLARMAERTDAAVAAGWLLPEDATDLMARACAARNRFPASAEPCPPYTPPAFSTLSATAGTPTASEAPLEAEPTGDGSTQDSAPGPSTRASTRTHLPATGSSGPAPAAALLAAAVAVTLLHLHRAGARRFDQA